MKKTISLFLVAVLLVCSLPCASAAELGQSSSSFSLERINHYLAPDRHNPLQLNIEVPSALSGGTLLVAFYTEGTLTELKQLDVSSVTSFSKVEFETSSASDDGLPPTPDKIRLFTWNKSNLKPLAYASDNMLTTSVISTANTNMVTMVLNSLLGKSSKKNHIDFLRAQFLDDSDKIHTLLDKMEECANDAYNKKDTQLLTSEYGRRMYRDEIYAVLTALKADSTQLQELETVYGKLSGMSDARGPESYKVLNRLLYFLKIDKDEFIKG